MTLEVFFAGAGGTLFGTVIGAWLSFRFQKKLLQTQLDFQKTQSAADAVIRKEILKESLDAVTDLRNTLNRRLDVVAGQLREHYRNANDE